MSWDGFMEYASRLLAIIGLVMILMAAAILVALVGDAVLQTRTLSVHTLRRG